MAALLGTSAMAQFKVAPKEDHAEALRFTKDGDFIHWMQIATPFVANDLRDGTQISLQSYLDDGKFVVIDYSACWCGPCWALHQSGLLEQLNELDNFQVIWVESEPRNTIDQINGTTTAQTYAGLTQGNWTDPHGDGTPVPFPMIDDDANGTCNATCAMLNDYYVPLLILIAPNGQACNLRGYFSYQQVAQSIQSIQAVAAAAPQAGQAPEAIVQGSTTAIAGATAAFNVLYNSVDPVSVSWTATGATPASGSGDNFTCSFNAAGTYEVSVTVTNSTGSVTATQNVTVSALPSGTLSYTLGSTGDNPIGTGQNSTVYWAVSFPPAMLSTMPNVSSVDCWVSADYAGNYTMTVYSGSATAPQTSLGSVSVNVTASMGDRNVQFNPTTPINVDQTKHLWIVMSARSAYPAVGIEYMGDPNSDWISLDGNSWEHTTDYDLNTSWVITAYSSAVGIEGASAAKVEVAPNPTADRVTVKAEGLRYIEVIDVAGRIVMTNRTSNVVDMSALNAGVYMFNVVTETGSAMTKVVKQ